MKEICLITFKTTIQKRDAYHASAKKLKTRVSKVIHEALELILAQAEATELNIEIHDEAKL